MSSFALWFSGNKNLTKAFRADVHFNLWDLHYKKAQPPCLDIGIKIRTPQDYSKVLFYIPWKIDRSDIIDLGESLGETEILCTVFNEDYTLMRQAQSKVIKVVDSKNIPTFSIYCLDVQNDLQIEHRFEGTLISFERPKQFGTPSVAEYYRLRICSDSLNKIIKCYSPSNVFLQSAVAKIEAIDFRFNDYRSLPPSLLEVMREEMSYSIEKVHFLLITESDVDLPFSSISPTARELEKGVWKKYYAGIEDKNVVAYHWKFKSENDQKLIENCIMFVKVRVHICNWKTIVLYLIVAGILAVFFNYISHLIF